MNYAIGTKLFRLRKKLGWSQVQLADELGITDGAISKWENGSSLPSTDILKKLAIIFNTTVDDLITEDRDSKKVFSIVITGGPCAGKSTAMSWIQNKFIKDGYKVIFVGETATELINAGITPVSVGLIDFQKTLLNLQLQKEYIYNESIKYLSENKVLVVYDRGCADVKGYLDDRSFKFLMHSINKNIIDLRDRYDAVFHLVTAANGAEKYYTLENNTARFETPEEAIRVDNNLLNAWKGHPHLRVIDNSTNFEDKMKKLISEVSHYLGEPEAYEIERKYLINYPNLKKLEKVATKVEIIQTYLKSKKDEELRIRQRGEDGNYIYYLTSKKNISGIKRLETEKRLSKDEYLTLLMDADPSYSQIRKTRYCLLNKNQYFEIDIYPFWDDKAIMEIELQNESDIINIPKYIDVIKEVTDDPEYKNASLARKLKK